MRSSNIHSEIHIVIMAHEREMETNRAINAIDNVDFGIPVRITVSDNPSSPEKALRNLPKHVHHVIREPSGDTCWHFNKIISEFDSEWALITHDDDEILPEFGNLFRQNSHNRKIGVVTGRSTIFDSNHSELILDSYEKRLIDAGIACHFSEPRVNFTELLFRHGSLFPASAIAVRTSILKSMPGMSAEMGLAYDLSYSMRVSSKNGVAFEGVTPVMKYYLHGNNSVFSEEAAGGLHADLVISRIESLGLGLLNYEYKTVVTLVKNIIKAKLISGAYKRPDKMRVINEHIHRYRHKIKFGYLLLLALFPYKAGWIGFFVRSILKTKVRKEFRI